MAAREWIAMCRNVLHGAQAVSADWVEARLQDARVARAECLFARGQIVHPFGGEWGDRIAVFAVARDRLRLVADCWMTRAAATELRSRVPEAASGTWDAMFATRWRYAWGGEQFRLWDRRGVLARVDGARRLAVRRGRSMGAAGELAEVHAEIAPDWSAHELTAVWADGERTPLARRRMWAVAYDSTYDGLDLLADASWLAALGADLAKAAGVPLHTNEPALERAPRYEG